MARAEAILAAVQRIHEAALASDGWTRALPSIADALGSQQANFHIQDADGRAVEFVTGYGLDPNHFARFCSAASAGEFPDWWQTLPTGMTARRSAMWPDRVFLRSAFYNEVVQLAGSFYGIQTPLLRMSERHVHLILAREAGLDDYEEEDIAAMQTLVPHLVTALHVSRRLAATYLRAAGAGAALDCLNAGVILVDAAARILFASPAAEAILAGNDGLGTNKEGICTGDHGTTRILRRLIASCANITLADGGPGGALDVRHGSTSLRVIVAPVRADALQVDMRSLGMSRPTAILIVTDPEHERRARTDELRRRFGLTPAEAAVALEIVRGDGREATASRLGIGTTTVRSHLSQIFEKTGVRRQAELVRVLLQSEPAAGRR